MSPTVNHEMVTLARESRAFTQGKLAEKAELTQGTISKIEHGVMEVSDGALEALSRALGYPPSFFYQSDAVYGSATACLHHRKRQSMPVLKLRQIHATINIMRMQAARLLNDVEVDAERRFHRMELEEYGSPEEIAQILRASWQLPLGPIRNMVKAIEAAGGLVIPSSFGTEKLDAISQWHWQSGQPPFFFVNADAPGDRLRWNLAHELGHIVMHFQPSADQEKEANRFAAEFLMPGRDIRSDLNELTLPKLAELKPKWKVAMQALIMRAHDLGTITDRQKRSFFTRLSQLGYRRSEPVPISREEPTVLKQVIDLHHHEHGYTAAELSRVAHMREEDFRKAYMSDEQPRLRLLVT